MNLPRILFPFNNYGNLKLLAFGRKVFEAMKTNPNFPTPTPTMAELEAALNDFAAAIADAEIGGDEERQIREDKRIILIKTLYDLAADVAKTAKGDRTILISSGYDISHEEMVSRPMGSFKKFNVKLGALSGTVELSSNSVKYAKTYIFMYATVPYQMNAGWTKESNSKATFTITGLTRGVEYAFQMGAVGANDQIVYSEIVVKMVV